MLHLRLLRSNGVSNATQRLAEWGAAREEEWEYLGLEVIQAFHQLLPSEDLHFQVDANVYDIQATHKYLFKLNPATERWRNRSYTNATWQTIGFEGPRRTRLMMVQNPAGRDDFRCLAPLPPLPWLAYNNSPLEVNFEMLDENIVSRNLAISYNGQTLDPNIIYGAFNYFSLPGLYRSMSIAAPSPLNALTSTLPIELQLLTLSHLSPSEASRIVRTNFPHLLHLYLPVAVSWFMSWFTELCSPSNLRYANFWNFKCCDRAQHLKGRIHTFRLKSIDSRPELSMTGRPPRSRRAVRKGTFRGPRLPDEQTTARLMAMFEMFYWQWKAQDPLHVPASMEGDETLSYADPETSAGGAGTSWLDQQDYELPRVEEIEDIRNQIREDQTAPAWPRNSPYIALATDCPTYTDSPDDLPFAIVLPSPAVAKGKKGAWCILLIYESELRQIFKEMDVVMAPAVFAQDTAKENLKPTKTAAPLSRMGIELLFDFGCEVVKNIDQSPIEQEPEPESVPEPEIETTKVGWAVNPVLESIRARNLGRQLLSKISGYLWRNSKARASESEILRLCREAGGLRA